MASGLDRLWVMRRVMKFTYHCSLDNKHVLMIFVLRNTVNFVGHYRSVNYTIYYYITSALSRIIFLICILIIQTAHIIHIYLYYIYINIYIVYTLNNTVTKFER